MTESAGDAHHEDDGGEAFQTFEPLVEAAVSLVAAAARGDPEAAAALLPILDQMAGDAKVAGLATSLRAIVAGDRDAARLRQGLDPDLQTLVSRVLAALQSDPAGAVPAAEEAPPPGTGDRPRPS